MKPTSLITSLEHFANILPVVVRDLPAADARWKPADGAWSILEVLGHLADEEVEDFRRRLELTLSDPTLDWPGIDPERSAIERRYNEADLQIVLDRFLAERGISVRWLKNPPPEVDWSIGHVHPTAGMLRAGDLLASWAVHDWLHLRQISKRLFQLAGRIKRDGSRFKKSMPPLFFSLIPPWPANFARAASLAVSNRFMFTSSQNLLTPVIAIR